MTKVSIMNIDLGETVDDIIAADITELMGKARQELDNTIEAAKRIQEVKEEKAKAKSIVEQRTILILETVYDKLVSAGEQGISAKEMTDLITPMTMAAFSSKLRALLSTRKNECIISSSGKGHAKRYILKKKSNAS